MLTLIRQNPAVRTLPRWLAISTVTAALLINFLTVNAWRHGDAINPVVVFSIVWLAVTFYMVFGEVRTRCSPFAMALPIPSRRVWLSHLTAVILSGVAVLAVAAGLVAGVGWLLWKFTGRWMVPVEGMGGIAVHAGAGLILAVALLQRPMPSDRRVERNAERVFLSFLVMGTILVLVLVLNSVSSWTVLITLALAATVGLYHYRMVPEVFSLETTYTGTVDIRGGGAVEREWEAVGRGTRRDGATFSRFLNKTIWRCFQVDVKLKHIPWVSVPFVFLMGALLTGIDGLAIDESMRFNIIWMAVYTLLALTLHYPKQLYLIDALPVSRQRILAVMVLPFLLTTVAGYGAGLVAMEYLEHKFTSPLDVIMLKEDPEDGNYYLYVPYDVMRISWDGHVPDTVAPWGERHQAWSRHLYRGSRVKMYTPYHTPPGSSIDYVAWQMSRAVEAVYGEAISPDELRERYLEVRPDGRPALSTDQLTIQTDYPQLRRDRSAGPAFPVMIALTFALWMLSLVVYLQTFRAGVSKGRRMLMSFGLLSFMMLGWLFTVFGPLLGVFHTPMVNAFLKIVMKRAGESPAATAGVWIVALAVSLAAYRLALWRWERVEAVHERKALEMG